MSWNQDFHSQNPNPEEVQRLLEQIRRVTPEGMDPRAWLLAMNGIPVARSVPDLYEILNDNSRAIYRYLTLAERIKNLGIELIISVVYIAFVLVRIISNERLIKFITSDIFSLVVPNAYAQTASSSILPTKDIIFCLLGLLFVIVNIMSAYAALFKSPPSSTGKEVLRHSLSFMTGVLAAYLGIK